MNFQNEAKYRTIHMKMSVLLLMILDLSLISITGLKVSFVHNRII